MSEAILFRKCLGLNDSKGFATQTMITSPRAKSPGATELIDCLNLTITEDGCLEKLPPLVSVLDTGAAVTALSARTRFVFSDGTNTKEWNGATVSNIGPAITGPVVHTPIDVRVSTNAKVYKSTASGSLLTEAVLGDLSNNPDRAIMAYSQQPLFKHAFDYNGHLYSINPVDPRFLQWSMWTQYDVWRLANDQIQPNTLPILQSGQIPNVVLTCHAGGVTAYVGSGPHDFVKRFYPCSYIPGTLYSGKVIQTTGASDGTPTTAIVYQHVFLCNDGLHVVNQDGVLTNVTDRQLNYAGNLNTSYNCATYQNGKYLAFGNNCCLEYDFSNKTILKRAPFGIVGACNWNGSSYFASGSNIVQAGSVMDSTAAFGCSLTLPYSDLSTPGRKSIECLYFTGTIDGAWTITATDQNGESWTLSRTDELVNVTNYRIKTPRRMLGNHISFKIECTSGALRIEELRAVLAGSTRSR